MSGKPYSVKEMRDIVKYLVDHNAYGEVKGRKMWIDFANSKKTQRSWQSLKETFLKRILPDLHNPYWQLTMDQKRSFTSGCNVVEKERNKLKVSFSEGSSINDGSQKVNKENHSKNETMEEAKTSGENKNSSKLPSKKTDCQSDVIVLTNSDIPSNGNISERNDENKEASAEKNREDSPKKSFRDHIIYSEPLTPMLQEMFHDINGNSDSEKENPMVIVETVDENGLNNTSDLETILDEDRILEILEDDSDEKNRTSTSKSNTNKKKRNRLGRFSSTSCQEDVNDNCIKINKKRDNLSNEVDQLKVTDNENGKVDPAKKDLDSNPSTKPSATQEKTYNSSNSTMDTLLPNNQEGLNGSDPPIHTKTCVETTSTFSNTTKKSPRKKVNSNSEEKNSKSAKQNAAVLPDDASQIKESDKDNEEPAKSSGTHESVSTNCSNITPDTLLPNNQEEFGKSEMNVKVTKDISKSPNRKLLKLRKRTISHNVTNAEQNIKRQRFNSESLSKTSKISKKPTLNKNIKHQEIPKKQSKTNKNNENVALPLKSKENYRDKTTENRKKINERDVTKEIELIAGSPTLNSSSEKVKENLCLQNISLYEGDSSTLAKILNSDLESSSEEAILVQPKPTALPSASETTPRKQNKQALPSGSTNLRKKMEPTLPSGSTNLRKKIEPTLPSGSTNKKNEAMSLETDTSSTTAGIVPIPKTSNIFDVKNRNNALAKIFGEPSGLAKNTRKRRLSRVADPYKRCLVGSESSSWTSESDSEYVTPPRGGGRYRHSRKYLKPKSSRIRSLDEEGGLFVLHGKKIYPLIKDGRLVKNYLDYLTDSDSGGEEESYWKLKYVEERKKSAQLARVLETVNERLEKPSTVIYSDGHSKYSLSKNVNKEEIPQGTGQELSMITSQISANKPMKTVKIKFTKNNEAVHIEGDWSSIHPAIEHVMHVFHKDSYKANGEQSKSSSEPLTISSGQTTPLLKHVADEAVHIKVNELEKEIFKEIEKKDTEEGAPKEAASQEAASKDAASKEAASKEAASKEAEPKGAALKEVKSEDAQSVSSKRPKKSVKDKDIESKPSPAKKQKVEAQPKPDEDREQDIVDKSPLLQPTAGTRSLSKTRLSRKSIKLSEVNSDSQVQESIGKSRTKRAKTETPAQAPRRLSQDSVETLYKFPPSPVGKKSHKTNSKSNVTSRKKVKEQ